MKNRPISYRTQEQVKNALLHASSIMRYPRKHSRVDKPIVHIRNNKACMVLNKRYATTSVILDLKDDWSKNWVYKLLGRKLFLSTVTKGD